MTEYVIRYGTASSQPAMHFFAAKNDDVACIHAAGWCGGRRGAVYTLWTLDGRRVAVWERAPICVG